MKANLVLLVLSLAACAILLIGCDSSGSISLGSNPTDPETSVEPGTKILPYTSPRDGTGTDDPKGHGDNTNEKDDGSGDQMPVPEPSTLVLVGSGIAIISLCKRRKRGGKSV